MTKNTPKHTPGPWTISRGAQADAFSIEAAAKTVAHIKHTSEAEANAVIIARAPDLLAEVDTLRAQLAELREAAEFISEAAAITPHGISWAYKSGNYAIKMLRTSLARTTEGSE